MLALWMAITFLRLSRRDHSKAERAILRGGLLGDDLQALHHAGHHFVLQAGIEILGVLAEDGQIERQIVEARLEAGQHAHRAEIRVEAELLAQRHVDALVSAADRGGGGSFEADARHFERSEDIVGNQLALFGERAHAGFDALPFDGDAGGVHSAYGSVGNFGSNAVAGDESDLVGHHIAIIKLGVDLVPDWASERRRHGGDATSPARHSRRARAGAPCWRFRAKSSSRWNRACSRITTSPIHIGDGQTISQPYMTALMAEALELRGTETVLEVGAGLRVRRGGAGRAGGARWSRSKSFPGWRSRRGTICGAPAATGNVQVVAGDGSGGYAEGAPYDAISVAAGAPEVPAALLEQLDDPGRLVIPVGALDDQELRVLTQARRARRLSRAHALPVRSAARRRGLAVDAAAHGEGPAQDRAQHHRWRARHSGGVAGSRRRRSAR